MPLEQESRTIDRPAAGWALVNLAWLSNPHPLVAGALIALVGLVAFVALLVAAKALWVLLLVTPQSVDEVGKALLAIGAVLAAPFIIWRLILSHWQARAALRQADTARESHFTSLFTKAVEQLGTNREVKYPPKAGTDSHSKTEPNIEVRLGAIYALERIAQDSRRDHWPIMETLCAYIRQNSGRSTAAVPKDGPPPLRIDIQAALTVIGRRSRDRLEHEDELENASTSNQRYELDLTNCNLNRADLSSGCFARCNFESSSLVATRAHKADLRGATFVTCSLAQALFIDCRFDGIYAASSDLTGIEVRDGSFVGAEFRQCHLDNARLESSKFHLAQIIGCSFAAAALHRSDFSASDISYSDFSTSNVFGASFKYSRINDSDFSNAVGIDEGMLANCLGTPETRLPESFERPSSWSTINPVRFVVNREYTDARDAWLAMQGIEPVQSVVRAAK